MKVFLCIIGLVFALNLDQTFCITQEKLYKSVSNKVYYIEVERKYDWFESLTKCARMNMSLVTIDSQIKSDDLNNMVKNSFKQKYVSLWVGGYAVGTNRQFTWVATGEEFTYTYWSDGNPDFKNDTEYCCEIVLDDGMKWNDNVCTKKFGFICEFKQNECDDRGNKKYHNIILNNYQKS